MATYKFEPRACYNENGKTYRPFYLNDKEIHRLDISIMVGTDKKASDQEMVALCEAIRRETGAIVSPGELPSLIKNKQIVVENG